MSKQEVADLLAFLKFNEVGAEVMAVKALKRKISGSRGIQTVNQTPSCHGYRFPHLKPTLSGGGFSECAAFCIALRAK